MITSYGFIFSQLNSKFIYSCSFSERTLLRKLTSILDYNDDLK